MAMVRNGLIRMLDEKLAYTATLEWALFPDDTAIIEDTVKADLGAEAAWAGYARMTAGGYGAAFWDAVNTRARANQTTPGSFLNNEASERSFFVLALIDPADETLIWAENLGETIIAPGSSFAIAPSIFDDN